MILPSVTVTHSAPGALFTGTHERAQEAPPVGVGAFQAPARGVANDVVSDVVHGLVKVVTGPGLVVGQRGLQRGLVVSVMALSFRKVR